MKNKIIKPRTFDQYLEEKRQKDPDFKKDYDEEIVKLQIGYKIAQLRQKRHLS